MSETEQKLPEPEFEQTEESVQTTTAVEEKVAEAADVAVEVTVPTAAPERKKEPPKGARSYELIFLVDAGLPKDELNSLIEKVQNFLEQREGVVDNVRVSDVRRLAYEIKKRTHGVYVVFNFWLKPNLVTELERMLRLEERVLRHMVIQTRA
ncbi:MAG: 30S ribosomal protein S6 [Armatimonadetes bacterium]|nr:30S ribosomal protein S6 [Armatimonadota bacterium]MCX7967938.1 30S ribosomal protein S6 [Armatimonadota bacterium]MDW8143278.1 30S ribosomal protein S6 [Armatimonadota bacterium]